MRFLGCTCVTDQLRVPNAVITLARLSLTENGRSGSRKKKHNSVSTIKKEKGLSSLFVHYFVHRGRNSRFRHKDHRVSSVIFFYKEKPLRTKKWNTRWEKGFKKNTRTKQKGFKSIWIFKKCILPNVAFVCPVFDMVTKSFKHALCRGDVTRVKHLVSIDFFGEWKTLRKIRN